MVGVEKDDDDDVVVIFVVVVWPGVVLCVGGCNTGWAPVVTVHQQDRYSSAQLSPASSYTTPSPTPPVSAPH